MQLKVLTYNIHKGIGSDGRFRLDRTIQILAESKADILCLQEVDLNVPRSKNQNQAAVIAKELGMEYRFEANVILKRGSYGNATISNIPITKSENLDVTWRIKKKRGCLITQHQLNSKTTFSIYNCHLGLAAFERNWQIHKLLTSEIHKKNHSLPVLILADSNDRRHKLNPLFEIGGYLDSCQTKRKRASFTFPAWAPVIRIDKIFYNQAWQLNQIQVINTKLSRITSDHRPVLAEFRLL